MDTNPRVPTQPNFPERMFAVGEEPVGIRVTPYHKPSYISKIFNALDEEETRFIRDSSFGKLIEIAEKPPFSGRFGRFLFSRQLKVRKKHEVWFLFSGKPIRFSIREFALVTGLNCKNYPPHSKKRSKKSLSEKPYWGELFGSMTDVPASHVLMMLRKKTVTDSQIRIKYAFLVLLASVILPTSHNPRISHAFTEKIKDLDEFLAYPWGRASFDMLMSSIKERNEVSLSQNTVAFKGFVMAVQLVLIEAVPSLMGVVRDGGSSGSEEEPADDEEIFADDGEGMKTINSGHVRVIDSACKANVTSIISAGVDIPNIDTSTADPDDEVDVQVDNLVRAVEEGFPFSNSNFKGGATKADVNCMREEAKKESLKNRKTESVNKNQTLPDGSDALFIANVVKDSVSSDICKIGEQMKAIVASFGEAQNEFHINMQYMFESFQKEMKNLITNPCTRAHVGEAVDHQADETGTGSIPPCGKTSFDPSDIINRALRFANNENNQASKPTSEDISGSKGDTMTDGRTHFSKINPNDVPSEVPFCDQVGDEAAYIVEDCSAGEEAPSNAGDAIGKSVEDAIAHSPSPTGTDAVVLNPISGSSRSANCANTVKDAPAIGLSFPDPSFSIGLTQLNKSDRDDINKPDGDDINKSDGDSVGHLGVEQCPSPDFDNDAPLGNRKSKRARVVPRNLVGDYQCDKRILTRAWESYVNCIWNSSSIENAAKFAVLSERLVAPFAIHAGSLTIESKELLAFVERSSHLPPKMLDVLINHTRSVLASNPEQLQFKNSVFLDTKFVSQLAKSYPKFSKSQKKENVRFPAGLCAFLTRDYSIAEPSRFYFPFNFDKQHWVGVCVDCTLSQVTLLDCNTSIKTDATVAKDLCSITEMFPYILRQAGKHLSAKDLKPLTVDRPRVVPQNSNMFESGITSILLIQAHAVGGIDVCKCITSDLIDAEIERTAVMIYEANVEAL